MNERLLEALKVCVQRLKDIAEDSGIRSRSTLALAEEVIAEANTRATESSGIKGPVM